MAKNNEPDPDKLALVYEELTQLKAIHDYRNEVSSQNTPKANNKESSPEKLTNKLAAALLHKIKKKKKKKGANDQEKNEKEVGVMDDANHKIAQDYFNWERDNVYYKKRYTFDELVAFEK
jgi:hypothetical protein